MATNTAVCSICDQQNVTTQSKLWCVDCEESFCENCANYHQMMKATKHHVTIPIEKQLKIADATSDVQQYCQKHNSKLVQFCIKHDQPICTECIGEHGKCGDVIPLSKLLEAAQSSGILEEVSEKIEDCVANIQKMIKDREERKLLLQREKMKCLSNIKEFRQKINSHLDSLEERFLIKVDCLANDILQEIQATINDLKQKENELQADKTKITDIQAHASEMQKYFYTRKVQEEISEAGRELKDTFDTKLEISNIAYSFSKDLQNLMLKVTEFGTVELKREQCKMNLSWRENKKAQFTMPLQPKEIDDITLEQIGDYDTYQQDGAVRGCCVVGKEDVVFTDHVLSQLVHFKNRSKSIVPIENGAFDVTKIDEVRVAVSTGTCKKKKNGVTILNLDTKKEERFIELPSYTYGVSFSNNHIYGYVSNKGVYRVKMDDCTISCVVPFGSLNYDYHGYVHVYLDKLYFADAHKNMVCCYTIKGDKVWGLTDRDLLRGFIGITADKNNNVFVSVGDDNIIAGISANGKRRKVLLTESDGIKEPTGLHYDHSKGQLVIAQNNEKSRLFKIV